MQPNKSRHQSHNSALLDLYPDPSSGAGATQYGAEHDPHNFSQGFGTNNPLFTAPFVASLVALFAVSLGVQLWHHFGCDHSYVMFAFDGNHYLNTCRAMTAALLTLVKGDVHTFASTISGAAFTKNLVWDGPIIPGIPALFFTALKRLPSEADWSYFAIYFSVLASFSAVLVASITGLLTNRKRAAIATGALFAFYPTTLIATGVYRSEMLAVLLMLSMLLALYKAPQKMAYGILAGVIGGLFAMVKPAMIPAIGLLCLFSGLHSRGSAKVKSLLTLALAGALTIASWSIYTAVDCGKLSITAERGPSYNAGVGTDVGADGWCTMPETEHVATAKQNPSPAAVFIKEWRENPLPLAKLTMRRVSRLWGNPWNDFREAIFGIPVKVQVGWHLLYIALGFMGMGLYLFYPPQSESGEGDRRLLGNLAAITVFTHLSFVLFQTMGRYAYTSMPLLIIFGVYGLTVMQAYATKTRQYAKPPKLAAFKLYAASFCGLACALLVLNCDSFTHVGESQEKRLEIAPGQVAGRSFELPPLAEKASAGAMMVLVDCEKTNPGDLQIRLNGHELTGPFLPLNCFNSKTYFLFDTMAEHAGYMRAEVQNFRQWRAVLVPAGSQWLSEGGLNEIEVVNTGKQPLHLFADRKGRQPLVLPSPDYFASDRMLVNLESNESRIATLTPAAGALNERSYLRTASGAAGEVRAETRALPDTLRIRLALVGAGPDAAGEAVSAAGSPAEGSLSEDVKREKLHWYARSKEGLHINKAVLKGVGAVPYDIDLKPLAAEPNNLSATQVSVQISGLARSNGRPGRAAIAAALVSDNGVVQGLGQIPDSIVIDQRANWQAFTLNDVVPLSRLGGVAKLQKLSLAFLPCPRLEPAYGAGKQCGDFDMKDLKVVVKTLHQTEIGGRNFSVY